MIIRSAILEGSVAEADRAAFDHRMTNSVLGAIARYPGIREVRLRRPVETDPGAPGLYMVFDLVFDTLEDMRAALASPVRQEVRAEIAAGMASFQGRVYHIVYEELAARDPAA
jgi:heme-degrading monooxygenase HmoA